MRHTPPRHRFLPTGALLLGALFSLAILVSSASAAEADPLAEAQAAHDVGNALLDAGLALEDKTRIRNALGKLTEAETLYRARLEAPYPVLTAGQRRRVERQLVEVIDLIAFGREYLALGGSTAPAPEDQPEPRAQAPANVPAPAATPTPARREGEAASRWARRVQKTYEGTHSPTDRAAMAMTLAREADILALPVLHAVFDTESSAEARGGLHAALAEVGTSRVARRMAAYARRSTPDRWRDALDVIYRCLEKSESEQPERPFVRAIREFHRLENRTLSLEILDHLDGMGPSGVAALGQILYVDDFGYHDHAISLLSNKRDARAIPPLVHKMNRFKFEYRQQYPAHEALLKLGWYAVPALIDRLDDKAAGIWISWTLRKITKETMGTQKRKWHDWWKTEKLRHPELFDDARERPVTAE